MKDSELQLQVLLTLNAKHWQYTSIMSQFNGFFLLYGFKQGL